VRKQLVAGFDQDGFVPCMLQGGAKSVAHKRRIVGDNDGFRADPGAGHVGYNRKLTALACRADSGTSSPQLPTRI
jgi:hypothetical protein